MADLIYLAQLTQSGKDSWEELASIMQFTATNTEAK